MAKKITSQEKLISSCVEAYSQQQHQIEIFGRSVRDFFASHPELAAGDLPAVHSVRSRSKDPSHLKDKIIRKLAQGRSISPANIFDEITDLFGVRILHLYSGQVDQINRVIRSQIESGYWFLYEDPVAYTWDPESVEFFEKMGIRSEMKSSQYTSVHYVIKPNKELPICCEIQVRTLFEETWGEIDHVLNYPHQTGSIACQEQIKVLAKIVGGGSRLAEAIFRSHKEFANK